MRTPRRKPADRPAPLIDGGTAVLTADGLLARVLYRDGLMLIIDKPAGMPVHAGPGGGANLEQLLDVLRFGLPSPPALAHRLDRDTSGCLVLGRHPKALRRLGRLFSEGRIEKVYWAVVEGRPPSAEGRIDMPLRKVAHKTGWRMVTDLAGQAAITDYRMLGSIDGRSWLELRPRTGRTHQIRVHCEGMGCPVLGDAAYGRIPASGDPPLQLHARAVAVPLYPSRPPIAAVAPVPKHILATLRAFGFAGEVVTCGEGDLSPPRSG